MKDKGENCYSVNRAELLEAMAAGGVLRWWKFGGALSDRDGKGGLRANRNVEMEAVLRKALNARNALREETSTED